MLINVYIFKDYSFNEQSDDDAGFMTLREKHWLAGIQTIQFNNSNPLEDDYYFTVSIYLEHSFKM